MNITIKNQNISNTDIAIELWKSNNNTIESNIIHDNDGDGIFVHYSHNNTIANNFIQNNTGRGIYLYKSQNNTIENNTIQSNYDYGMYLRDSYNNIITNNTLIDDGIFTEKSYNNVILDNLVNDKPLIYLEDTGNLTIDSLTGQIILVNCMNITIKNQNISNTDIAIYIWSAQNNTIVNSTIQYNDIGVYIMDSSNILIYLNNFICNNDQYRVSNSQVRFNSTRQIMYTYKSNTYMGYLGNYWSDYIGNDTDGNGVGDAPYDSDNYPTMGIIEIVSNEIFITEPIDTIPPTITIISPENCSFINSTIVILKWNASDNLLGIYHFELYIDEQAVNTDIPADQRTYTLTLSEGTHEIMVKAIDKAGNSASHSINIIVDLSSPTVTITSPEDNSTVGTTTVIIEWTANDNISDINHFELYVDEQAIDTNIPAYQRTYTRALDEGTHKIELITVDNAGNSATHSINITIDISPPTSIITSPEDSSVIGTNVVVIEWTASDEISGISHFELYIDGQTVNRSIPAYQRTYTQILSEGTHGIELITVDNAGNSAAQLISITIDTSLPTVTITSPEDNSAIGTTFVTIEWNASDEISGISHFELYIDGQTMNTEVPADQRTYTQTLSEGTHEIMVKAIDKVGNSASHSINIIVDISSPTVTITSPENDSTIDTTVVVIEWNASDEISGISHFELYVDSQVVKNDICPCQKTYILILEKGSHIIELKAIDKAGNSASYSINIIVSSTASSDFIYYYISAAIIVPIAIVVSILFLKKRK